MLGDIKIYGRNKEIWVFFGLETVGDWSKRSNNRNVPRYDNKLLKESWTGRGSYIESRK